MGDVTNSGFFYKPWPIDDSVSPAVRQRVDEMRELRRQRKSIPEIARACGLSKSTVHKYVKDVLPAGTYIKRGG